MMLAQTDTPTLISTTDARGCAVTGATARAVTHFETALAALLAWRTGVEEPLVLALQEAPGFVMAHVFQAWLLVCSRDVRRVHQARAPLARALQSRHTYRRERLHVAAVAAVLEDDYPLAKLFLGQLLQEAPRDVLALQAAHALDYLTGDLERLGDRAARVLPAWHATMPGHHAVLAMHAFGLVERGEAAAAECAARAALASNRLDLRAHHAMAHVFEASGRAAEGMRWLQQHADAWASGSTATTHLAWHLALFHLEAGEVDQALDLYDRHIGATARSEIADLIDASALLWRMQLRGVDLGRRWLALADAWAPRIDDGFCSFSDVHAMLAFVGARDDTRAQRLLKTLATAQSRPTRHGHTTRQLGMPACRALVAFGQRNHALAITLLASLPSDAHRLGGSHAQRDVLHLTLLQAVERVRRPAPRTPMALAGASSRR